jgi:predicted  nucleic acid-binding Zn-ribbon protein
MSEGESSSRIGLMRCISCSGQLGPSGQEVYRMICMKCGQNYFVRLVLEPVPPITRSTPSLPETNAE